MVSASAVAARSILELSDDAFYNALKTGEIDAILDGCGDDTRSALILIHNENTWYANAIVKNNPILGYMEVTCEASFWLASTAYVAFKLLGENEMATMVECKVDCYKP